MKKTLGFLLSFALLLGLMVPVTSVSAYTGGLLHGKELTDEKGVTTSKLTDGDHYTTETKDAGSSYYFSYSFSSPVTIGAYQTYYSACYYSTIEFYNSQNVLIKSITTTDSSANKITIESVTGVSSIRIYNETGSVKWADFDVFGAEDSTPPTTPPEVSTGAILTITMTNGLEKEYDLSATQLNAFMNWYDAKAAGTGSAKYAFVKTWNKGPSRTEYVIFDKILTFSVDEYGVE